MSTPHNSANMGDIAKIVLMPGDPLRAKVVAENFLSDVVQFNSVRNIFGYTGTYKGKKVSVMASGMGIPSIGIYSYELYKYYGVEKIIRIGSTGAFYKEIPLYDTILVTGSYSDSSYALVQSNDPEKIQKPSENLVKLLRESSKELNIPVREGIVYSSDVFYGEDIASVYNDMAKKEGCIAAEMESFGLFHNAKVLGKEAACLLTVSDNIETKEETTHDERRIAFVNMMKIALEAAIKE